MNHTAYPTRTDTAAIPRVDPDDTVELLVPWLLPPTTTRHRRRPSFLRHLRASARAAFWPAVAGSGLLLGRYLWDMPRPWTRDDVVFAACLGIAALCGLALVSLRNPRSYLSRLVDGPADDTTGFRS